MSRPRQVRDGGDRAVIARRVGVGDEGYGCLLFVKYDNPVCGAWACSVDGRDLRLPAALGTDERGPNVEKAAAVPAMGRGGGCIVDDVGSMLRRDGIRAVRRGRVLSEPDRTRRAWVCEDDDVHGGGGVDDVHGHVDASDLLRREYARRRWECSRRRRPHHCDR